MNTEVQNMINEIKSYEGQDIVAIINGTEKLLENVKVIEQDEKIHIIDNNDICNIVKMPHIGISDVKINTLDIFNDEAPEIHIKFQYLGLKCSLINLV